MTRFAEGDIKILISTTVIEVGIDVPEATNIAIYGADRYGLSQLHQLRGRVGRGREKSYCFLIPSEGCSDSAMERLEFLVKCSDGFKISEYDFEMRGAGDFLGNSQHGKHGDFSVNVENITVAKQISAEILQNSVKKEEIKDTINENKYAYFRNITLN
jgi:ATP-dependent DNA helicase RecG